MINIQSPIFWGIIIFVAFFVISNTCLNKKRKETFGNELSPFNPVKFDKSCSAQRCSTSFPKFPGVPSLAELPKPPEFSTVQEDYQQPAEWKDPVQWKSPNKTLIVGGYGGIGTIEGDNYQFFEDQKGGVAVAKISGFESF